ncbi:hypothetical protein Emag_005593 [Eimeria magna]
MDASYEGQRPRRYRWLPEDQQGLPATMSSAAGAGLLSRAVMHPLDTAKAVIQVQTKRENAAASFLEGSKTLRTLSSIWKTDGLRGLYRGFAITSTLAVPATCLYFSTYEILKARLLALSEKTKEDPKTSSERSFVAALMLDSVCGFSAEAIACVLYLPMDVCKERLQVYSALRGTRVENEKPTLRNLMRGEGVSALYRGYGATLLSFGPFSALFFTLNHQFSQAAQRLLTPKASASQQSGSGRRPLVDATVAAAAAGAAAFVTAPLDKVKLRLQVQSDAAASQKTPFYYRHVFHGLSSLLKTEGLSGCFAGVGARTTFQAGSFFVMFLFMQNLLCVYEILVMKYSSIQSMQSYSIGVKSDITTAMSRMRPCGAFPGVEEFTTRWRRLRADTRRRLCIDWLLHLVTGSCILNKHFSRAL